MKRLVFLVLLIPSFFISCNSDDKEVLLSVSYEDPHLHGTKFKNEKYYLLLEEYFVVNAACPNRNYNHYDDNYLYRSQLPDYDIGANSYTLTCLECGAKFRSDNGKAKNDIAKGYSVRTYNYDYDRISGWVIYK